MLQDVQINYLIDRSLHICKLDRLESSFILPIAKGSKKYVLLAGLLITIKSQGFEQERLGGDGE